MLRGTTAAVLVSGYGHPLYDELHAGWHPTEIRVTKPSANHGARGPVAAGDTDPNAGPDQ